MAESPEQPASIHLSRLLFVAVTTAFVTALIAVTGELQVLWPLYVVPILIGAFAYQVAGAVVTAAVSAALLAFLVFGTDLESSAVTELVIGMTAFAFCGVVVGALVHRERMRDQQLEESSILDPLTGVFKPQYLRTRLSEELLRSERYDLSCTLALVRVDDLDAFRERFGQYKAELVLEHLADILTVTVRTIDIVARHGPVAFGIVAPATDIAGAAALAHRIRTAVGQAEFEGDVLEPAAHLVAATVTATYPDEAADSSELLSLAEERLSQHNAATLASSGPESAGAAPAQPMPLDDGAS